MSISRYRSGSLSKPILSLATLALIALVSVACSDSGDEATVPVSSEIPTEQAEFGQYGVCYEPTESLRRSLADTLVGDELGMRAFFMARQPSDGTTWTIAVDIEGPGLEGEGPIAILDGAGQTIEAITIPKVVPFNDVALQYTSLDISVGRDHPYLEGAFDLFYEENLVEIQLIQSCIGEELATNPETKVYR